MVIGSDNANVIHKWINYEQLLEKVPFIVFERKGQELKEDTIWCLFDPHIFVKYLNQEEYSSTRVRSAIKNGESIKKYVPENVAKYIKKNKLYV
jgi:nicotinate-nucleotide adenylyltransferase